MAADLAYQSFGPDNYNSGFGVSLQYDNRDVAVNAWQGIFASATTTFYTKALGSYNNYQVLNLDLGITAV